MATYLDKVNLINLGSKHEDWLNDVKEILMEIDHKNFIDLMAPKNREKKFKRRLRELRHLCLISDQQYKETRNIKVNRGGFLQEGKEEEISRPIEENQSHEKDELDGLLEEALNPPMEEKGKEILSENPKETGEREREAGKIISGKPDIYGTGISGKGKVKEGVNIQVTEVVDCYGVYVKSLKNWIKNVISSRRPWEMERMEEYLKSMEKGDLEDGPGILICPENIKTIYPLMMRRNGEEVVESLAPELNPDFLFLKMTLLHELGHHVYPCPNILFSEGMANWLVLKYLNPEERMLLQAKTDLQSKPYKMYLGILNFLYPNQFPAGFPYVSFPWPIPGGTAILEKIEVLGFDGELGARPLDNYTPWKIILDWVMQKQGFEMEQVLRFIGFNNQEMALHRGQTMSLILFREMLGRKNRNYYKKLIFGLTEMTRGKRVLTKERQQACLEGQYSKLKYMGKND